MRDLYQQLTANSIEINQAQLAVNTAQAALRYQQAQPVQQRFALPDKKPVIKAEPQQPVTGPSRGKLTPPSKKEKGRYDESDDDDDNRPRQCVLLWSCDEQVDIYAQAQRLHRRSRGSF